MSKKEQKETGWEAIDKFLDWYKTNMPQGLVMAPNDERYEDIRIAMHELTLFIKKISPDAKIEIKPANLLPSAITFEATTDEIIIEDVQKFCRAISLAANFEVYPRSDGKIKFGAVFHQAYKLVGQQPGYELPNDGRS